MLAVISPAKKLDFENPPKTDKHTLPDFLDKSGEIVAKAKSLSKGRLKAMMKLSDNLADLNHRRYQDFEPDFTLANAKQAAFAFMGDTYVGLQASELKAKDLDYAQNHLRILSGLYGVLRPLDLIQPYRLEMGTKFPVARKPDLYAYWRDSIAPALDDATGGHKDRTIVNLASNEYFKAVDAKSLESPVVTPVFKEIKDGQSRTIGMFAKQARGMMARFIIEKRIETPTGLTKFTSGGYEYRDDLSDGSKMVFTRPQP